VNWQQDFREALRSTEELNAFFDYDFPETNYPIFIPKNFAKKIKDFGEGSPLWIQFLPDSRENENLGRIDPIGDKIHSKGNQLIHRYENRALFTPTTICPIQCRYCFRKNELSSKDEIFDANFEAAKNYLLAHPEINEIIFTGGDPLILSDEKLAHYLQEFAEIESIKFVRFHTRTPIILPSRIDEGFINIMTSARHLFKRALIMIHVNHLAEIDEEVESAITRLTEAGVEVLSQTVLLKGVNDQTEILEVLLNKLSELKVTPYYLHHPDEAKGAMHFGMTLEEGRRVVHPLHSKLSGWATPKYVIDIPGGEGKISAINPEDFTFKGELLNRQGNKIKI
jgi:lysine 2,3-aminomutase